MLRVCVPHLYFKREVFLHILDDHDEEREFDAERFLWVGWTRYVRRTVTGNTLDVKPCLATTRYIALLLTVKQFFII